MIEKPSLAEHTRPLGFNDAVTIDRQVDIVTHAAAKGASGVLNKL
jgi:hypothetical protein